MTDSVKMEMPDEVSEAAAKMLIGGLFGAVAFHVKTKSSSEIREDISRLLDRAKFPAKDRDQLLNHVNELVSIAHDQGKFFGQLDGQ